MGWIADHIAMSRASELAAIAAAVLLVAAPLFLPATARADFGIESFTAAATNQDGSVDLAAGSHPYDFTIHFAMNLDPEGEAEGSIYSMQVDLPPGLVGSPQAVPFCDMADFDTGLFPSCPARSQIGVVHADTRLGTSVLGLYNLRPPPGAAAAFGFGDNGSPVIERLSLGADGTVRVSAPVLPTGLGLRSITETIWGVPADRGHDGERGACLEAGGECSTDAEPAPLLTLPTSCGGPLRTTITAASLEEPERSTTASALSPGEGGLLEGLRDCEGPSFDPRIGIRPEADALSPSGLLVDLELPQTEAAELPASAALRQITVRLPAGLTFNSPAAAGLAACSPAQIGLESVPGGQPPRFDAVPVTCPDASKLGTASVQTPLLDHLLPGAIYLATPGENPSGAIFAIYVVLEDPTSGTILKLPGRLDADPADGRLTATISDLPQLPFEDMKLSFFGGPRAALTTPSTCGTYTTTADAVPSTVPAGSVAHLRSSFTFSSGAGSGPCPPGALPNDPDFEAGAVVPIAGLRTPFVLRLQRQDASQQLAAFDLALPPGLSARLAGAAVCADAAIPSCPASSSVGQATVGTGVGSAPLYLRGTVYLAGPYRGAPVSLLVVVPALAGPFDLGTVVVRVAVQVDPVTGQLSAASDSFPQILRGVPLAIRSLAISLDRPGFIRNPTSCDPMRIDAGAVSTLGQVAPLSSRFQLGACAGLAFQPRAAVRLLGPIHRGAHPRLRTVLRPRAGDANIRRVAVTLPGTELLDNRHIGTICTAARFAAERCPAGSVYGFARAWTPLLDQPLEGPVYLRSSRHRLPDLAASLDGQIHLDLTGHVNSIGGRIRNTLVALPDVPLSKVVLTMAGGKRGLLVNTGGLCAGELRAAATFDAQNGKTRDTAPLVKTDCGRAGRAR